MEPMNQEEWSKQIGGENCPFCLPRDEETRYWKKIKSLSISTLYLHKIQSYLGYSLLIYDKNHSIRSSQLRKTEWESFCEDLRISQLAIEKIVKPDHINIAALGNQLAHLHWHIIPRYNNDARWGKPIWTTHEIEMEVITLQRDKFNTLAKEICAELT